MSPFLPLATFRRELYRMKKLLYAVLILVGVAALGYWFATSRATQLVNSLLRDFASAETARLSDSTYVLNVGELHVNWPARRITLDSVVMTTDTARNSRRTKPLATTRVALRNCTIGGIEFTTLIFGRGLVAGQMGCRDVELASDAPADLPSAGDSVTAPRAAPAAFIARQQSLKLPSQVPALRLGAISFPNVAVRLVQRYERGDHLEFVLERAQLRIKKLAIDPADSAVALRPLFSESVVLTAENAAFRPDTATSVSLGRLDVNITDSTVSIQNFAFGPLISDAAFAQRSPYRRDRIRVSAHLVAFKGLDIDQFARSGSLHMRALELDSLLFELRSDKRKPSRPGPKTPSRSIQGFMASRPRSWGIDTIRITNSQVAYEQFAKNRDTPGRLVFSRLNAVGTSFVHLRGITSLEHPFHLDATTWLMDRGRLHVVFDAPFDAPANSFRAQGTMGPLPASALNPFVSAILPAAVKGGQLNSVNFAFRVENGRATGTLTPLYTGLAVDVTGTGMHGVLGNRGIVGGIVRGAAELAAGFKVRANNPDKPDRPPTVGHINYTFHGESLPSFFWNVIKTGLLPVVVK